MLPLRWAQKSEKLPINIGSSRRKLMSVPLRNTAGVCAQTMAFGASMLYWRIFILPVLRSVRMPVRQYSQYSQHDKKHLCTTVTRTPDMSTTDWVVDNQPLTLRDMYTSDALVGVLQHVTAKEKSLRSARMTEQLQHAIHEIIHMWRTLGRTRASLHISDVLATRWIWCVYSNTAGV